MKRVRMLILLIGLGLVLPFGANAQGNLYDNATKVAVTEPLQVPGTVLQPGEYVFRLADSASNRHIVRIFSADESKLITTVLAIANERLEPTDNGIMTYEERPVGEPVALEAWFYSGRTTGQQFVYPKSKAETLSRLNRVNVPSTGTEEAYPDETASSASSNGFVRNAPAPAPSSSQGSAPVYSASAQTNAPAPTSTTTSSSAPAPSTSTQGEPVPAQQDPQNSSRLPATASSLPLLGALGSLLLVAALLLKWKVRA